MAALQAESRQWPRATMRIYTLENVSRPKVLKTSSITTLEEKERSHEINRMAFGDKGGKLVSPLTLAEARHRMRLDKISM